MPPAVSAGLPARSPNRSMGAERRPGAFHPEIWVVLTATAIAALLRFGTLGHQSFWVDEASTVHEVGLSFGAMLHAVAHNEATPPLYFACAWVWTRIFGSGEVGIRSLSALMGTAIIPVIYLCGGEMISRRAGAIAAWLTAISPFMIWYSQEARAYIMLALLCGLSMLFTARALRTRARRDLGLWALLSALALATHFFAVLLVMPEGLWLLWRLRNGSAGVALACVIAVEAALSPLAISDAGHNLDLWIGGLSLHQRIQAIPVDFGASQLWITSAVRYGLVGAGLVGALLAVLAWRSEPTRRRSVALPAALAAIVVVVPLIGAAIGQDYVFSRNLMPAWLPLIVLIAGVAGAERARVLGVVLIAVLALLFVWADVRISSDASLQKTNWRGMAAALGHAVAPRAVLIYDGNVAEEPLSVYLPGTTFSFSGAIPPGPQLALGEIDVVASLGDVNVADLDSRSSSDLPPGFRLISQHDVDDYVVVRFGLSPARELTPPAAVALAGSLVPPASATTSVLVQR